MKLQQYRKINVQSYQTYLWLYRFNFCKPYFESIEPFETGKDSKLAINKFIDAFSSSM